MTPCELLALDELRDVCFGMDRGADRFVGDLCAKPDEYELSPRQKWNLARLSWRYRRQLSREISDWALETYAGAAPPPSLRAVELRTERKKRESKIDRARAVLSVPLRFGDRAQMEAGRWLAKMRELPQCGALGARVTSSLRARDRSGSRTSSAGRGARQGVAIRVR